MIEKIAKLIRKSFNPAISCVYPFVSLTTGEYYKMSDD